ncbi:MAG TPA: cysteine--tRNA ligase [Candidatus Thalassarchaeaceae archaeon]|nr:cysteine--tRNA ligase [Candidatus Thalassarchaeaceae archaeon]
MTLHLYDTRRKEKVAFHPAVPGKVQLYVCGITPYSPSHLGHARCYIAFDLLHRWLEASGYDVDYVQNFTDIDDKIINIANEEGIEFLEVANRNIEDYYRVMDTLGVERADHYPRVTEHLEGIIKMIEKLIEKGHAYTSSDGVWFSVSSAPEKFGTLTGNTIEAVQAGGSGRLDKSDKREHNDFALWKAAKPGEPAWNSPWGKGRPGWHIECSAMSLHHFGESFDIHGGGFDLRFPHHEAEIFQSECCTGKEPVVGIWMHNGFVRVDGEKMSKSLGNFWTVTDAFKIYEPIVLRYALLNAHYRNPIDVSEQLLNDAKGNQRKISETYGQAIISSELGEALAPLPPLPEGDSTSAEYLIQKIGIVESLAEEAARALDDDLNSRLALSKVQAGARIISEVLNSDEIDETDTASFAIFSINWMEEIAGSILGVLPTKEIAKAIYDPRLDPKRIAIQDEVEGLLARRSIARHAKDWTAADEIRDALSEMGVTVKDTSDGVVWSLD